MLLEQSLIRRWVGQGFDMRGLRWSAAIRLKGYPISSAEGKGWGGFQIHNGKLGKLGCDFSEEGLLLYTIH